MPGQPCACACACPHPQDLIQYGLIPEFVGRLPVIVATQELGEEQMVAVLTEPRNALVKQYTSLLAMSGARLR